MRFKEILSRLTGIDTPIFGVSWNPPEADITVARRLVRYLEDRRVLYNPWHIEIPEHCIESVIEIRRFLSDVLQDLATSGELEASVRAMRSACRKFLDTTARPDEQIIPYAYRSGWQSWAFFSALGELRGVFGVHLAKLAAQHGLDVEEPLSSILPAQSRPEDELDVPRRPRQW